VRSITASDVRGAARGWDIVCAARRATRRALLVALGSLTVSVGVILVAAADATTTACVHTLKSGIVTAPTTAAAWRAALQTRTAVCARLPDNELRPTRLVSARNAPWLLVLGGSRAADGRCWIHVRLPWRPNGSAGWVNEARVLLRQTPWRIAVSTARRTAHSNVLQAFDGGDATVGIHGRGATSLLDPLGSASSHGCIRLANHGIDWLVHTRHTRPNQLRHPSHRHHAGDGDRLRRIQQDFVDGATRVGAIA
jgi:hypothetical protein